MKPNTLLLRLFRFLFTAAWLSALVSCSPIPSSPAPQAQTASPQPSVTTPTRSTASSTASAPETVSQLSLNAEDVRGQIVRYWHIWSGPAGEVVQALVNEFNLGNSWGITIVSVEKNGLDEMDSAVTEAIKAGDTPEVVVGYLHQALAWEQLGELVDLQPYAVDPLWGFSAQEQSAFYPIVWQQDINGGRRLGIPAQRSAQVLYYNQSWAKTLGFNTSPASPEQFREQACAAAQANRQDDNPANDGTGGWIISTNYAAILGWIYAFGGNIAPADPSGLLQTPYQFATPQVEAAFIFLRSLYDKGCAWLPESQLPDDDFANRLGLFASGSVIDIPYQALAFQPAHSTDQWTVISFPGTASNSAINIYGPSYVMLASSPERQLAAWLFITWLLTPQNQARLIEATGSLPLQFTTLDYLKEYTRGNPQWATAVALLTRARPEPSLGSWATVRWALGDAATQLFRSYFTIDQVPNLLEYLDWLANDLHQSGAEITGAHTETPSPGFPLEATATAP